MATPVVLPEEVPKSGYYPTEYAVLHSPETATYHFRLRGFEWRDASIGRAGGLRSLTGRRAGESAATVGFAPASEVR